MNQKQSIFNKNLAFIVLLVILVVAVILSKNFDNQPNHDVNPKQVQQLMDKEQPAESQSEYVFTATQAGQLAIELMDANQLEFETQDFGEAGVFIKSVAGLAGDDQHYWAVYQNDDYAQVGISQLKLNAGDELKLVYEEIDPNQY